MTTQHKQYCGPAAHKYLGAFLPVVVHALDRATPGTNNNKVSGDSIVVVVSSQRREGASKSVGVSVCLCCRRC